MAILSPTRSMDSETDGVGHSGVVIVSHFHISVLSVLEPLLLQ